MTKVILPSLTPEQVDYLIANADNVRDKAIISLFADSGIRLNELLNIKAVDIDPQNMTVTVWGKGGIILPPSSHGRYSLFHAGNCLRANSLRRLQGTFSRLGRG
jgi:integrase